MAKKALAECRWRCSKRMAMDKANQLVAKSPIVDTAKVKAMPMAVAMAKPGSSLPVRPDVMKQTDDK